MEYTKLGNTDIEISKICLGCMSFGKAGTMHDWTLDEKQSEKIIKYAIDNGINFFDTANSYSKEQVKNISARRSKTTSQEIRL